MITFIQNLILLNLESKLITSVRYRTHTQKLTSFFLIWLHSLPKYEASHEMDRRRAKQTAESRHTSVKHRKAIR
jgi:hypothetical protein